jgi:polyketide cyclase/dehydrase/lipid transport protein
MTPVSASIAVPAALPQVWDLYFDRDRWAGWVDQFAAIVRVDPAYPAAGSELVWRSGAAGRGEVAERVLTHERQHSHRIEFSDPSARGNLSTTFAAIDEGTEVTLELDYELEASGPFARLSDVLFVRSQMRGSLARSLRGLRTEVLGD